MNFMFSWSHCNAGAHRFSLKIFRLYRIAAPASAMASEQFAAFRKLPVEGAPPFTAAIHSLSAPPPPPPPRPPRPPCTGSGMPLAARYSRIFLSGNQLVVQD